MDDIINCKSKPPGQYINPPLDKYISNPPGQTFKYKLLFGYTSPGQAYVILHHHPPGHISRHRPRQRHISNNPPLPPSPPPGHHLSSPIRCTIFFNGIAQSGGEHRGTAIIRFELCHSFSGRANSYLGRAVSHLISYLGRVMLHPCT